MIYKNTISLASDLVDKKTHDSDRAQSNKISAQNQFVNSSKVFGSMLKTGSIFHIPKKMQVNFQELQKKLSNCVYKIKKDNEINITRQNIKIVILSLAKSNLSNPSKDQKLLQKINQLLQTLNEQENQSMCKFLIVRQIKKQTFDITTQGQDIFQQIRNLLICKGSIFKKIVFEIWYDFILQKYEQIKYSSNKNLFKKDFKDDLHAFMSFISDLVFYIFRSWFYIEEKKCNIYNKIYQQFAPGFITMHKNWKKIYGKILKLLGKTNLKLSREDKDIQFFQISSNMLFIQNEIPFHETIISIQQFYSQYCVSKKINKMIKIANVIKKQILKYQNLYNPSKNININVDTQIAIFQYCILKSQKNGIYQSIQYLQMFFEDSEKYTLNYIQKLNIPHLLATIKGSALKLKERDQSAKKIQQIKTDSSYKSP